MLQAVFPPEWLRLCGNGETLPGQQGVQPFGVIAGFQQKSAVERVIEHGALLEVQVRIAVNAAQHPLQGRGQHLGDADVYKRQPVDGSGRIYGEAQNSAAVISA